MAEPKVKASAVPVDGAKLVRRELLAGGMKLSGTSCRRGDVIELTEEQAERHDALGSTGALGTLARLEKEAAAAREAAEAAEAEEEAPADSRRSARRSASVASGDGPRRTSRA